MTTDIHILMEIDRGNGWELVRGDNEKVIRRYEDMINDIEQDDVQKLIAAFDGRVHRLQGYIEKHKNVPKWIHAARNNLFFMVLSGVNSSGNIPSFKRGGDEREYGDIVLSEEAEEIFEDNNLHSHTVVYGDEVDLLELHIKEQYQKGKYNRANWHRLRIYVKQSFSEPMNRVKKQVKKGNNVRFLIAYDN